MYHITTDINAISIPQWDNFIENHPNGTVFQSYSMYLLFKDTNKFEPVVIAAYVDHKIVGICLSSIIKEYSSKVGFLTSRTICYGGPLIDDTNGNPDEILDLVLKRLIKEVKNKSVFIQFRNFFDRSEKKSIFGKHGFTHIDWLNFQVDTSDKATTVKGISKSKIRQINKGLRLGAKIIDPENIEQVRSFYIILKNLYKNKVGKPLPDWSFFENFYSMAREDNLGIIRLILYKNKIIGGILLPLLPGKIIYEWYICGLDKEHKDIYPSALATWAPIEYAMQNNIGTFDFMGAGSPDKDYGVREFKSKFGGKLLNFGRFERVNNKYLYRVIKTGFKILAFLRNQ